MSDRSDRSIRFTKMHGLGNDYIYIDCTNHVPVDLENLAREMSDRHIGVGGDGIILICPSEVADYKMRIFNADGSEARMCGNGSRCVGKFIFDRGMIDSNVITIETLGGIKQITVHTAPDGTAAGATVDMGEPSFDSSDMPVGLTPGAVVEVCGFEVTPVSMGNPHGVIFCDCAPMDELVHGAGPRLENAPIWPERANIEFVEVVSRDEVNMRVWERGSGETMACGTGACATLVAGVIRGKLDTTATIHLSGGDLSIRWDREGDNHVYMTGPATEVFEGTYKRKS